jgi:rare lipoprotein A
MTHLTAAHPTMPLPSYARVTNLETGSSVIVRVNDRGPYHEGRIIDVSERAAQMLDYDKVGTARVKVEYVGRAPLDGDDDQYLVASYHPGNNRPDPSDGLPTGVMVAMNGPSPSLSTGVPPAAVPFPGQLTNSGQAFAAQPGLSDQPTVQPAAFSTQGASDVVLPDFGPIVPVRPDLALPPNSPFAVASLSYADERVQRADVFAALDAGGMSPADVLQSWRKSNRHPTMSPPVPSTKPRRQSAWPRRSSHSAGPRSSAPNSTAMTGMRSMSIRTAMAASTTCFRRPGRMARRTRWLCVTDQIRAAR